MQYSYGAQPNSDFISGSEYQPSSLVSLTEFLFRTIFSTISTNLAWYEQLREKIRGRVGKGSRDLIGNIMEYPFLAEEEQYYAIAKVIVSHQPEMICDSGVW